MQLPLVGEQEDFQGTDYQVSINYPEGYEWLNAVISYQPLELFRHPTTKILKCTLNFQPRKPLRQNLPVVVENPLGQKWRFVLQTSIAQAAVMKTIVVESPLNVETAKKIQIDEPIRQRTHFSASLAPGSTPEFRIFPDHGVIEASLSHRNDLPVDVLFRPTAYGKVMRAVLIIDTMDIEYVIEIIGTLPEYVPPIIEFSGRIMTAMTDSTRISQSARKPRRNIIRENIESVKLSRPQTTRTSRTPRPPFLH
jgi:hypothetical protein